MVRLCVYQLIKIKLLFLMPFDLGDVVVKIFLLKAYLLSIFVTIKFNRNTPESFQLVEIARSLHYCRSDF